MVILWSLFGYFIGAIPFAVILGNLFTKQDIRKIGDGNPGGTNVWKAGGWKIGLIVILLDSFKGYLPVVLARSTGISDWSLLPICLSPIVGHATTPFLNFRGGKALAATGGVWVGLLGVRAFLIYGATALLLGILTEHAWAAVLGVALFLGWAIFVEGELWMVSVGVLSVFLIAWTHRHELTWPPRARVWLSDLLPRRAE
jgi:glycerol-3-phosphate acyltransferase PlsY